MLDFGVWGVHPTFTSNECSLFARLLNQDTYHVDDYLIFELGAISLDRFLQDGRSGLSGQQSQHIMRQLLEATNCEFLIQVSFFRYLNS